MDATAMEDDAPTPEEIVNVWRDTTRAAELVDRLSEAAIRPVTQGERDARAMEKIADLAEQAARSMERGAARAREAATEARRMADQGD